MKIYTKKGDSGETSLIGGTRVPKHHIRIEAYGTTDELNSYMGLLGNQPEVADFLPLIREVQYQLFVIGSHLANDEEASHFHPPKIDAEAVTLLEKSIDEMDSQLPALKNFVLPGSHPASSIAHIARCVCRRAERNVVHLNELLPVEPLLITYLNRLSDWLFTLSRWITQHTATEEVVWKVRG